MDGSEPALPGSVAQGHRQGPVPGCSPAAPGASAASLAAGRCSAPLPRGCLNGAPRQAAALGRAAPLCLPAQPPVGPLEHHSGPCYHLPAVPALAPTSPGWQRAPRSPGEPWPSLPGPSLAAAAASICLMAPAAALARPVLPWEALGALRRLLLLLVPLRALPGCWDRPSAVHWHGGEASLLRFLS